MMEFLLGFLAALPTAILGFLIGFRFILWRLKESGYKFKYNDDTKKWDLVDVDENIKDGGKASLKDYSLEEIHNECCDRRYVPVEEVREK